MRKMMGLVLAGAAAFALTACSGNNASQSTEAAATTVPGTQTEAAAETESGSYTVTDVRGKKIEFDAGPGTCCHSRQAVPVHLLCDRGRNGQYRRLQPIFHHSVQ